MPKLTELGLQNIDLHVHTNASDGDYGLETILQKAKCAGLKTIAITDHDTTKAVQKLDYKTKTQGIEVIAGIEISALAKNNVEVHVLGYFFDDSYKAIEQCLAKTRLGKTQRTLQAMQKFNDAGYRVQLEDVEAKAKYSAYIGSMHLWKALVAKGYFDNVKEAEKKARLPELYVPYSKNWAMSAEDAVRTINNHNGVAVLAHPGSYVKKIGLDGIEDLISELKQECLFGVEVYSTKHDAAQVTALKQVCRSLFLAATSGSDYHGDFTKPNIEIGSQRVLTN